MPGLRIGFVVLALVATACASASPASGVDGVVLAVPGSFRATYATPVAAVPPGGGLAFTNVDVFNHDVVADGAFGGGGPWCRDFATGRCPLFWSPLATTGQTVAVLGLDALEPGEVYPFYCTLHPGMKGRLVAAVEVDP